MTTIQVDEDTAKVLSEMATAHHMSVAEFLWGQGHVGSGSGLYFVLLLGMGFAIDRGWVARPDALGRAWEAFWTTQTTPVAEDPPTRHPTGAAMKRSRSSAMDVFANLRT